MLTDNLMTKFHQGYRGMADLDMVEVLHDIIADVLHSVGLAMSEESIPLDQIHRVIMTVNDYVTYGES